MSEWVQRKLFLGKKKNKKKNKTRKKKKTNSKFQKPQIFWLTSAQSFPNRIHQTILSPELSLKCEPAVGAILSNHMYLFWAHFGWVSDLQSFPGKKKKQLVFFFFRNAEKKKKNHQNRVSEYPAIFSAEKKNTVPLPQLHQTFKPIRILFCTTCSCSD